MNNIENYYLYSFNYILLSKLCILSLRSFPQIKNLTLFFIINTKQYKKNLLLLYIIINLIFGGILVLKTNVINSLQIINLNVKKRKIFFFLQAFIHFYLPLLNSTENVVKKAISFSTLKKSKNWIFRLNYFSFPVISELDLMYESYELIYNFVTNYKLQLDVFIKPANVLNGSNEFLLRMYKIPCVLQGKVLLV